MKELRVVDSRLNITKIEEPNEDLEYVTLNGSVLTCPKCGQSISNFCVNNGEFSIVFNEDLPIPFKCNGCCTLLYVKLVLEE